MKVQAKNGKVTQNMHGASKIIDAFGTYQQHRKLQRCLDHVRQLTRSRKWKHKEGRGTSHSYWSRTHGLRRTTHVTSGRRPWRWMVSRRGFLLPVGCRGSFSWQPQSLNGGGGGTERRMGIA